MTEPPACSHTLEHDAQCYVHRLPNELLITIFKCGLHNIASSPELPLLLTSICNRWRRVALAAPEIWCMINIATDMHLSICKKFLERSQNYPIHAYIGNLSSAFVVNAEEILRPHILRLTSLELDTESEGLDSCRKLMTETLHNSVDQLRLHVSDAKVWDLDSLAVISAECYPNVRTMNLRGITPRYLQPTPFSKLSFLTIHTFSPSLVHMRDLLANTPLLSTLILPGFICDTSIRANDSDNDAHTPEPIMVPSLRFLAFSLKYNHPLFGCNCPLAHLHAPNLEYLEGAAGSNYPSYYTTVTEMHGLLDRTKHPKIRTLRLDRYGQRPCERALPCIPSLERLEVSSAMGPLHNIINIAAPDVPFPFPNLSSLYWTSAETHRKEDYDWLRSVASLRSDPSVPFIVETSLSATEKVDEPEDLGGNVIGRVIAPSVGLMSFHNFTSDYDDETGDDSDMHADWMGDDYEFGSDDYDFGSDDYDSDREYLYDDDNDVDFG